MTSDLLAAMMAGAAKAARDRAMTDRQRVERDAADRRPNGAAVAERLRGPGLAVIAECKRRSPSKGILRVDYAPGDIAAGYERAGAAAISVLTDGSFFDGSLDHLREVRARVSIPVLRKDFISDVYQVTEARAAGADMVLLIVAGLDDEQLAELLKAAADHELASLVEVHDKEELRRALGAGAEVVGVNSRNLRTLEVNMHLHEELAFGIPADVVAVAESGVRTGADLRRLKDAGYDGFLVGERFMTTPDPGASLAQLLREAQ